MTETPPAKSRWRYLVAGICGTLLCLALLSWWLLTTAAFWERVGWRLVAAVQDRVYGQVAVGGISGNLVTGMIFRDVKISRDGADLIRVQELEVSLSLWSLVRLEPVIRTLAFRRPEVWLRQDAGGSWNVAGLLKKRPPPPFAQIHLPGLQISGGVVHVDRPQGQQTFEEVNVELDLTVQAPGRPRLTVMVHQGRLGFSTPPYPALRADLALSWSHQEIHISQLDLALAEVPVLQGQGSLTDLAGQPRLALKLAMPALTGAQLQQLWPAWPAGFNAAAGLEVHGPLTDLRLTGTGAVQDCQWRLSGWRRQQPPASPEFHLTLDFQDLTPAVLAALTRRPELVEGLTPLRGTLVADGREWPWSGGAFQARVDLAPFAYRQAKIEAASVQLAGGPQQNLALSLRGNFGRLESRVKGRLWPGLGGKSPLAGEVTLSADGLNPALLPVPQGPPGSLKITFTGDYQLPAALDWRQARLAGTLQAGGTLKDQAFQEFLVKGRWEAGQLHLNPARLVMGNLRAEASGQVSLANADLKLSVDLSPPGPWPLPRAEVKGRLRLEGALKGPWQSLAYQGNFQGQGLSWRQLALASLQGQAAGTVSPASLTIATFDVLARDLQTPAGRFGLIQGQGRTQEGALVFSLKTEQAPGQSGSLAGSAAWEGSAVKIRIAELQWGPPQWRIAAEEPVTLTAAPGRVEMTPLRLRHDKTRLTVGGKIGPEEAAGQARLENLRLADVAKIEPRLGLLQGAVNAQLDLGGTARTPVLRGQVDIAPGQIGHFRYESFHAGWHYQDNVLRLNGQLLEKPDKGRLAWQGESPLTLSLVPWSWRLPETGLNLRAWTENLTMGLFADLIPGVAASSGPLGLQAQATGSLTAPVFAGALRYGPGSLTIRESGAPLAIDAGEIRLEGERLVVPRLVVHSGDGQGVITGGAQVGGFRLRDVNLSLTAKNLLAVQRDGSWAVADGQLGLQGSWPGFQAGGRLVVTSGQFRLNFFRSERNREIVLLPRVCRVPAAGEAAGGTIAVVRNFQVDLTIEVPGNVWLRDKDIKAELEGEIKVQRRPPGPKYLGGWVKAKNGAFAINNKVFNVEKAELTFPGEPHKPIQVEARAARQVEDITLYVFASGPLDNPRTGLDSNPPLSPRDQLSLLVFDHLADKMTREEYVTVTQKAMGLLGSVTAQKLKSLLGESLPLIGDVSPTTSQEALGVGKRLGKDITVSYERKLNPLQGEDVNQVRLDYKVHKYFTAETQLGRKNTGGDLFFNIDF